MEEALLLADGESNHEMMISVKRIIDMLEQHLGCSSEIVLHDLRKPYEQTIVDIRHGEITGRKIGGCGSNLGLEVIRGIQKAGDSFNYITHTKNGKILRSSTIYLYDNQQIIGALCINTDITETLRIENYMRTYNGYSTKPNNNNVKNEHFAENVSELLDCFIKDAQDFVGVQSPLMSKEEKGKFIQYLDQKGAFLITKSSDIVCDFLGISKYTFYQLLEQARENDGNNTLKVRY